MSEERADLRWLPPAAFGLALAVVALAWHGGMRHPSYIRQVFLTGLVAPGALALALGLLGPCLQRVRAALRRNTARVFLCAIWAHAILAALSMFWTSNLSATLDRTVVLLTLAVWGTAWLLAAGGGYWRGLAWAVLAVAAVVAFVGASSHFGQMSLGAAPARLSAPIGNANTVAVLMFLPIVVSVSVLARCLGDGSKWPWPGLGALVAMGFGGLAFCFAWSRSGFVGLGAALVALVTVLLVAACRRRKLNPGWGLVPAAIVVVVLGVVAAGIAGNAERRGRLFDRVRLSSVGARYYGSMACWEIFKDNTVAGAGAGTFLSEAPSRIKAERYAGSYGSAFLNLAHNEYAETGAELGCLGLLAFLAVLGSAAAGAWRGARRSEDSLDAAVSAGLFAVMVGVAVSAIADPSFRYWDFTATFYAAGALAAAGGGRRDGEAAAETAAGPESLRVPRLLLGFAGVVVAGCSSWLWAYPDMYREMSWLEARRASKSGNHEAATGFYRVAVRENGYFLARVLAHHDWILERASCGRGKEAVRIAEELNREMPRCPQVLRQLFEARLNVGDRAGALAALVAAGRLDPYSRKFPGDFLRAFEGDAVKDAALVETVCQKLRGGGGERAVLESMALAARKSWPQAATRVGGVRPEEVGFAALELWRGLALLQAGRASEAVEALALHVARHRFHAHGYWHLAEARRAATGAAGSDGEVEALRLCLKYDLEHEQARLRLVRALTAGKRYDDALAVLLPYLPIARRKESFFIEAARIRQLQGRPGDALQLLRTGLRRTRSPRIKKLLQDMVDSGRGRGRH